MKVSWFWILPLGTALLACSSDETATGGPLSTGGSAGTGGAGASGGVSNGGGTTSTGGVAGQAAHGGAGGTRCDNSGVNPAHVLFVGDFEHGITPLTSDNDDSPFYSAGSNGVDPEVVAFPDHPVRCGQYSMRSYIHAPEYRSEVVPKGVGGVDLDAEYWFGVSIHLPADWSEDYLGYDDGALFQLHHNSWSGYPDMSLPLTIWHQPELEWRVTCAGEQGQGFVELHRSSYLPDKGRWTDWVFHVRFSDGPDGFVRVWKNGSQVADRIGSNYHGGHPVGPNFQFGLYQWGFDENEPLGTDERSAYHDEFRLGNESATYEDVAPGGLSPL